MAQFGRPSTDTTRDNRTDAYDQACAVHGELCDRVQSLVAWEAAESERQAEERNRRLFPRGIGEDL